VVETIYRPVDTAAGPRYPWGMRATRRRHPRRLHPRNAAATRERVLALAEDAFARRGFEGASLDEIAALAGVRKATLFYYFPSKEALYASVAALVAARFAPLVAHFAGAPSVAALDALVGELHDRIAAARGSAVLLMREALASGEGSTRAREANDAVKPILDAAARWLRAGQRRGVFAPGVAPRSLVAEIAGAVAMPFLNPLFRPDREGAVSFVHRALAARRSS